MRPLCYGAHPDTSLCVSFSGGAVHRGVRHRVGGAHAAPHPLHQVRPEVLSGQNRGPQAQLQGTSGRSQTPAAPAASCCPGRCRHRQLEHKPDISYCPRQRGDVALDSAGHSASAAQPNRRCRHPPVTGSHPGGA